MRPISGVNSVKTATKAPLPPPSMAEPSSPLHSTVPYLFGGLAAVLGLLSFAILILVCSSCRHSGRLHNNSEEADAERDVESGDKEGDDSNNQVKVYEEKFYVIMAGEEKPTFLATPTSTKASSFGDKNGKLEDKEGSEKAESREKVKEETGDYHEQLPTITENSENHT